MKAMREIGHQDVPWVHTQWGSREVDVRARDELLARLFKEISTGKTSGGVLGQFARFCVVGTSNTVIDFGVLNAALAAFPTRATVPLLAYNTAAVVLAATNSFVCAARCGQARSHASPWWPSALMGSFALGANVLKLRAILGALALSFFGMRFWVFIGNGCHLTSLQKRGACPHCPGRTGLQKTIVFKNRCPLLLSSRVWRCNHDSSILESLCREQLHHPGDSTVNCHRRVAVLRHAITSPHSRQKT